MRLRKLSIDDHGDHEPVVLPETLHDRVKQNLLKVYRYR